MTVRDDSPGTFHEVDRFDGGVGWMVHPEETMERTSHGLQTGAGVYLVDPLDCEGLDDELAALGDPAGVVVLCGFHTRDAGPIARRYEVPVYVPDWVTRVPDRLPDNVERRDLAPGDTLPGSDYELREVVTSRISSEGVLWHPEDGTLIVGDILQATAWQLGGNERVAIITAWRLLPPREALGEFTPQRILTGHGEGIFEDADEALRTALEGARRNAPGVYLRNLPTIVRMAWTALRH